MSSNISKRGAIRILRRAGYQQESTSKRHELWTNGKHRISLPHKPISGVLYGWLANQILRIEAGADPAKLFKREV